MQGLRVSKGFTTGLIAAAAMIVLAVSLFAVQPAHADEGSLVAGTAITTQKQAPKINVKQDKTVKVAKSVKIVAKNETAGQTVTWKWEVVSGKGKVSLTNAKKATVTVKGVKGGIVNLKVTCTTSAGVSSSANVAVTVNGIQKSGTAGYLKYKRTGVNTVTVVATNPANKNFKRTSVKVPAYVKLGDNGKKAQYKVTAIANHGLKILKNCKSISTGPSVQKIGEHAFCNDPALTKLVIGKGAKVLKPYMLHLKSPKAVTVYVNSTQLTKANVKNCFGKNKNVKTVYVKNAQMKKVFAKANTGATNKNYKVIVKA